MEDDDAFLYGDADEALPVTSAAVADVKPDGEYSRSRLLSSSAHRDLPRSNY